MDMMQNLFDRFCRLFKGFYAFSRRSLTIVIFWATLLLTVKIGVICHTYVPDAPGWIPRVEIGSSSVHAGNTAAPSADQHQGQNKTFPKETPVADDSEKFDPLDLSDSELSLLRSLAERRAELAKREKELGEKEALIQAMEKRVQQTVSELTDTKKQLEVSVQKQEDLKAQRERFNKAQLQRLVKIYEGMPPENAAVVLSGLDLGTVISVLDGMKEKSVSAILDKMGPGAARAVTMELFRLQEVAAQAASCRKMISEK